MTVMISTRKMARNVVVNDVVVVVVVVDDDDDDDDDESICIPHTVSHYYSLSRRRGILGPRWF
jgi:hypothetical protein